MSCKINISDDFNSAVNRSSLELETLEKDVNTLIDEIKKDVNELIEEIKKDKKNDKI